ncbi:hypothetical protein LOAG_07642 [Loa loa]|uniref:Uncharacterized protein n=1 Tax=Loa loa TaxID=7209 RepID=A0A1S0TVE1_LOALO|nr:hypothetical protein LOAG_07642 [Loa loa]EFO20846.1 hypothetical protein LOAG_07642 [Loa loa]
MQYETTIKINVKILIPSVTLFLSYPNNNNIEVVAVNVDKLSLKSSKMAFVNFIKSFRGNEPGFLRWQKSIIGRTPHIVIVQLSFPEEHSINKGNTFRTTAQHETSYTD